MRLATQTKKAPPPQPRNQPNAPDEAPLLGWERPFFAEVVTASGMTRKDLKYELRVSDTYVDGMMNGTKQNPVSRARVFCDSLHARKRPDLVMTVLVYIAGVAFDGRILSAAQVEAIRELAKAVTPLKE